MTDLIKIAGGFICFGFGQVLAANIAERLSMRNFLEELRSSGVQTGGPAAFSHADRQAFGATLDRFLARHTRA